MIDLNGILNKRFALSATTEPVGGVPKILTFQESLVDPANKTVYTFSGASIGAAASNRRVIVGVSQGGGAPNVSVTVGGISADLVVEAVSGLNGTAIWIALVPSGTTADIVVTCGASANRLGIGVWSCTGLSSNTPIDTDAVTGTRDADLSVSTAEGGFTIGATETRNNSFSAVTWTGLTERYDQWIESGGNSQSGADLSENDGLALDVNAYFGLGDGLSYSVVLASF